MCSRFWFVLHRNNQLFTIPTVKEPLIVVSTHKETIRGLMNTLRKHKVKTNKWMNKCRMHNENVLYLTEQDGAIDTASLIQMAYIDLNDEGCVQTLHTMYNIHKMRVFMMTDFVYSEEDASPDSPLLSVQGLTLHNGPPEDSAYMPIYQYLDVIYDSN